MLFPHFGRLCQYHAFAPREATIKRTVSLRSVFDAKAGLFSVPVQFKNVKGDVISLNAIYQDTMPEGGQRATVLALHGAPGSHADFKYLVPELRRNKIRMIMPDYPGQGFTANDPRLNYENEERNAYVQAVLERAGIAGSTDLYVLGHSRGGENALQVATSKMNLDKVCGLIMLNSTGLRIHQGLKPLWHINLALRLLDLEVLNFFMYPFLYFVYNYIMGLKVPSGEAAATALRTVRTFAFGRLLPCIEIINQHPEIKCLHAYSGNDFLIETDVSKEFAEKLNNRIDLECCSPDSLDITRSTVEAFSGGAQAVSVNFTREGHFLQKFRAKFLVDIILALVSMKSRNDSNKSDI